MGPRVFRLPGSSLLRGCVKGRRLTPLPHDVPFWFAWTAFWPEAQLR